MCFVQLNISYITKEETHETLIENSLFITFQELLGLLLNELLNCKKVDSLISPSEHFHCKWEKNLFTSAIFPHGRERL